MEPQRPRHPQFSGAGSSRPASASSGLQFGAFLFNNEPGHPLFSEAEHNCSASESSGLKFGDFPHGLIRYSISAKPGRPLLSGAERRSSATESSGLKFGDFPHGLIRYSTKRARLILPIGLRFPASSRSAQSLCEPQPLQPALSDLFRQFDQILGAADQKDWDTHNSLKQGSDALLQRFPGSNSVRDRDTHYSLEQGPVALLQRLPGSNSVVLRSV